MMNSIEKLISVSGGVSLLYVEDDLTLQQETAQLLRNFFEKIDLAQNGEEGLEPVSYTHLTLPTTPYV